MATDNNRDTPPLAASESVRQGSFVQERATTPLRVTCYGSSSSSTPNKYLQEAFDLGYLLAKRGHTCVNGAGSFGCMAAMNSGAEAGDGNIIGVIHEMWLNDLEDSAKPGNVPQLQKDRALRDGGAHPVFGNSTKEQTHGGPHPALSKNSSHEKGDGPIREMLVAGGADLQERKRLLVENAQALVVLPGGPGTFDELWEASCARNIGLKTALPIVCINCDGYYDPFKSILQRAYDDKLTKLLPDEIIHFEDTAEGAIKWIEAVQEEEGHGSPKVVTQNRAATLRKSSFLGGGPTIGFSSSLRQSLGRLAESLRASFVSEEVDLEKIIPTGDVANSNIKLVLGFAVGLATGVIFQRVGDRSRR